MQKRQLEKRRRTRKSRQRGGGPTFTSIEDWISAVNASPVYAAPPANPFKQGSYTLSDINNDNSLQLPNLEAYSDDFDLDRYAGLTSRPQKADVREVGAAIAIQLTHNNVRELTPVSFKDVMEQAYDLSKLPEYDDLSGSILYMVDTENKLRQNKETITRLDDASKYPLYIWALLMSAPAKPVDPPVSLAPVKEMEPVAPEAPGI